MYSLLPEKKLKILVNCILTKILKLFHLYENLHEKYIINCVVCKQQ